MFEEEPASESMKDLKKVQFAPLEETPTGQKLENKIFAEIPVQVTVDLGEAELTLKNITELEEGSIIELKRAVGEPLLLKVGDQIIAKGEVVTIDDHYGIRITQVLVQ